MNIEVERCDRVLVVRLLDNRLDASVAYEFKERMEEYVARGEKMIVLNIAAVDFVDSSGLGAIVSSLKRLGDEGDIVISGAKETVVRLFKLTRMNKVFRMYEAEDVAIDALA